MRQRKLSLLVLSCGLLLFARACGGDPPAAHDATGPDASAGNGGSRNAFESNDDLSCKKRAICSSLEHHGPSGICKAG